MKNLLLIFNLSFILFFAHCAKESRGFDRGPYNQPEKIVITDVEISNILKIKPQLPFPFRLGIYLSNPYNYYWSSNQFDSEDKNTIFSISDELVKAGIVSEAFFISNNILPEGSGRYYQGNATALKNIRYAAARYNADAVLIIDSDYKIDSYSNPFSFFYLTGIGLWIAPGSSRDATFNVQSSLWDVKNEFLYLTTESDGLGKIMRPYIYVEDKDAILKAKKESIKEFKKEIISRMNKMKK